MQEILGALKICRGMSVDQIIQKENISTYKIDLESAYGVILKGGESYIFIDKSINEEYAEFVMLHELGHYFLEHNSGSYLCTKKNNLSEVRANVYACLMLGFSYVEWINHGCPIKVAKEVNHFISQNMENIHIYMGFNKYRGDNNA